MHGGWIDGWIEGEWVGAAWNVKYRQTSPPKPQQHSLHVSIFHKILLFLAYFPVVVVFLDLSFCITFKCIAFYFIVLYCFFIPWYCPSLYCIFLFHCISYILLFSFSMF